MFALSDFSLKSILFESVIEPLSTDSSNSGSYFTLSIQALLLSVLFYAKASLFCFIFGRSSSAKLYSNPACLTLKGTIDFENDY
jgi:hypothetical protein